MIPLAALSVMGLAACQTAPTAASGFLSRYEGAAASGPSLRASVLQRRDDQAVAAIERLFIDPAIMVGDAAPGLNQDEILLVLQEVDRQVCYELSERFTVVDVIGSDVARVRAGVTRIRPTNTAGSVISAAASYFIPGPVGVRVPGSTGGLAAEVELLDPKSGQQVAMLAWARDANNLGTDDPSLSRVGDALQFAEPLGDAVGDAFSPPERAVRPIPKPDPCAVFGPRRRIASGVAQRAIGFATGLYVPEVTGAGAPRAVPTAD